MDVEGLTLMEQASVLSGLENHLQKQTITKKNAQNFFQDYKDFRLFEVRGFGGDSGGSL